MKIKEAQEKAWKIVEDYNKKHNLKHNKDTAFLHLIEEVGEVARELYNEKNNWRREFNKEKFSKEVIDVIYQALILATDYDIDVEKVLEEKMQEFRTRFELD